MKRCWPKDDFRLNFLELEFFLSYLEFIPPFGHLYKVCNVHLNLSDSVEAFHFEFISFNDIFDYIDLYHISLLANFHLTTVCLILNFCQTLRRTRKSINHYEIILNSIAWSTKFKSLQ